MANNVNYLSDKALNKLNQDDFHHQEIANTLKDIVLICPTPFTIGLFGGWGTGKSTIAQFLEQQLEQTDVAVVVFDVWKYEGNSLRRGFLLNAAKKLKAINKLKDNFKFELTLDGSVSETYESDYKFSFKKALVNFSTYIPFLLGIIFWIQWGDNTNNVWYAAIVGGIVSLIVGMSNLCPPHKVKS